MQVNHPKQIIDKIITISIDQTGEIHDAIFRIRGLGFGDFEVREPSGELARLPESKSGRIRWTIDNRLWTIQLSTIDLEPRA